MIGLLVNFLSIALGGIIGLLVKKAINKNVIRNVLVGVGLCVGAFGIVGLVTNMIVVEDGTLKSQNELVLLLTVAFGVLIGSMLKIDQRIDDLGARIESKYHIDGFMRGFVSASLVFSIGAMAIFGSIEAAKGNNDILLLKSAIDFVTAIVLSSTLGYGVIFSSIACVIYELVFYIIGLIGSNFVSEHEFSSAFNMVGYLLVITIGINFLINDKEKEIKTANFLPSLILVVIYFIIKKLLLGY